MSIATLPAHGTLSRRKAHACKCELCRKVDRDYMATRHRLLAYGRWQPYVDAEPVRAHVRMLMSYGIGWQRICKLSGVSNGGMSRLLYGSYGRGYGPNKRVRVLTADKIFAVKASFEHLAPSARVDGTGTRRRLQALVAIGWPQLRLAQRLGIDKALLFQQINGVDVEAATARAVRTLYNEMWNADPASHGVQARYIAQAQRIAAGKGWPPPAAWDDDWIDSPAATADLGESPERYVAIAEDANWLIAEHNYSREQAAHRLSITVRHLDRALADAREREAVPA